VKPIRLAPFIACALLAVPLCSAEVIAGTWSLEKSLLPGQVRLILTRPGVIVGGRQLLYLSATETAGLDSAVWETDGAPVNWVLARGSGTLRFEGVSASGRLSGRFRFIENPEFAAAIRGLVYNWWDPASLLDLALRGVPLAFAQALRDAGASGISASELARRYENSVPDPAVDPAREAPATGAATLRMPSPRSARVVPLSAGTAARLRSLGLSRAYYEELKASGYAIFPEDAARLNAQGVSPDLVRQMKLSGHDNFNTNEMIRLQNFGVTADDVRSFEFRTGRTNLSVDDIVRFKTNGVR
jgi:hypothetical protein